MIGMRDRIVTKLAERNTVLTPDALEYLNDLNSKDRVSVIIDKLEENNIQLPFPVCRETISCLEEDLSDGEKKKEI